MDLGQFRLDHSSPTTLVIWLEVALPKVCFSLHWWIQLEVPRLHRFKDIGKSMIYVVTLHMFFFGFFLFFFGFRVLCLSSCLSYDMI